MRYLWTNENAEKVRYFVPVCDVVWFSAAGGCTCAYICIIKSDYKEGHRKKICRKLYVDPLHLVLWLKLLGIPVCRWVFKTGAFCNITLNIECPTLKHTPRI